MKLECNLSKKGKKDIGELKGALLPLTHFGTWAESAFGKRETLCTFLDSLFKHTSLFFSDRWKDQL